MQVRMSGDPRGGGTFLRGRGGRQSRTPRQFLTTDPSVAEPTQMDAPEQPGRQGRRARSRGSESTES